MQLVKLCGFPVFQVSRNNTLTHKALSKHSNENSEEILKTLKISNFVIQINVDALKATQNQLKTNEEEIKANLNEMKVTQNQLKASQDEVKASQDKIKVRFCGSFKKCLTASL